MRLFRSIASAQHGRIFMHMGAAYGINDELAAQIVRYFLPPLHKAIVKRMESQTGLITLLELIGTSRHDRYLANPAMFSDPRIEAEGRALLGALIPNRAYIRRVIENRAKVLPLPPEMLERMLPIVTILTFAAVELRIRQPMKQIQQKILGANPDPALANNPYKAMAQAIRERQSLKGQEADKRNGLASMIGALFGRADERRAA